MYPSKKKKKVWVFQGLDRPYTEVRLANPTPNEPPQGDPRTEPCGGAYPTCPAPFYIYYILSNIGALYVM